MKPAFAIQTFKGNVFDPKTGTVDNIDVKDIAHALSNLCRYAGHCREFYSVAEHSVLTYKITQELWPLDLDAQWAALLHDATEAYVGDVPTPLKVLLPRYYDIEDNLAELIAKEFKIKQNKSVQKKVKTVDLMALATEAPNLFEDTSHWAAIQGVTTFKHLLASVSRDGVFRPRSSGDAESYFLYHYNALSRRMINERDRKQREPQEQEQLSAD